MDARHRAIAKATPLLMNFPDDVCEAVLDRSVVRRIHRGTTIFEHGEHAHSVYIVLDGWVKLFRVTLSGSEAVVGVFTKGRSFGEAVAFRSDVYPVSAEAVTDCELVQVPTSYLLDLVMRCPEVGISILASTFTHLQALVSQIEQLKALSGAQRIAQFLVSLLPDDCTGGPCQVTLPYDKILIAGRIGMKPESLSRAFLRLKDYGVTIKQNHALIEDVPGLIAFGEDDYAALRPTKPSKSAQQESRK